MKKRFTIMLKEETIELINQVRTYYSPIGLREDLEKTLKNYATKELESIKAIQNCNLYAEIKND